MAAATAEAFQAFLKFQAENGKSSGMTGLEISGSGGDDVSELGNFSEFYDGMR